MLYKLSINFNSHFKTVVHKLQLQNTSVIKVSMVYVGVVCVSRCLQGELAWATDKRL